MDIFQSIRDVGGWHFKDMAVLISVGTGSFGLMQICFGGGRNLAKMIMNGDLDPFMTQPKNVLLHVLGSKSFSKGWGHLMTAMVIILFERMIDLATLSLLCVSTLCGCLVFTAFNIVANSLPFWMGSVESLSKKYCDALCLFALYPTNIYSGLLQILMFTLIPAGMITYLPVELFRNFSWILFFGMVASTIGFFNLAFLVFYSGLKRYESGNKFGTRL